MPELSIAFYKNTNITVLIISLYKLCLGSTTKRLLTLSSPGKYEPWQKAEHPCQKALVADHGWKPALRKTYLDLDSKLW